MERQIGKIIGLKMRNHFSENLPNFNIYPNPTNDLLTISTNNKSNFTLYDLTGKTLKSVEVDQTKEISIIDLEDGIYILKEDQTGLQVKIIKQ